MKKNKKVKKKKLKTIPQIKRRLFKKWSEAVLTRDNYTCQYCGIKKGDINKNGKIVKIDAHHLVSRNAQKNSILNFDLLNGIALCPTCHKWGGNSFHKNPVKTIDWLRRYYTEQYNYILDHCDDKINLNDRAVLKKIEEDIQC